MCFRIPNRSVSISDSTDSNQTSGRVTSVRDGSLYDAAAVESASTAQAQSYITQGAAQKANAITDEAVSIKGAVSVPAASNFTESKKSINEISTEKGDIAKVKEIDICPFLSEVSSIDLGNPADFQIGDLPSLNDVMGAINGVTLPVLQVASDAITGVVGKVSDAIGDLGKGLQDSIPKLTCGKSKEAMEQEKAEEAQKRLSRAADRWAMSQGLDLGEDIVPETVVVPPDYGAQPNIVIDSPDVTVRSISDELDSGEF
jgi:hypothetical protein